MDRRMTVLAILQARMSSRRLPGKVMADLAGEPMIWRQIERVRRARRVDHLVVATSVETSDDPLASFLLSRGCSVFRGDLDDVLGRFAAAAGPWGPSHLVRLTADCPLADPAVIDAAVELALHTGAAYASNVERRTYPKGLDVEVIASPALAQAAREATDPYEREHVTPFVRRRADRFRHAHLVEAFNLSHLRWTVDQAEDLAFVREVYAALHPKHPAFDMFDVLQLMDRRPDIADLEDEAVAAAA